MGSTSPLPDLPQIGLTFPKTTLGVEAVDFVKQHCDDAVTNHVIRSAYWAMVIARKMPDLQSVVDVDTVIVGCILHDMGWAASEELISKDKRFEVDGANIGRDFVRKHSDKGSWNEHKIQRMWDSIAFHTVPSINRYAAPEVALTGLGIAADFGGPFFPNGPGAQDNLITMEEYNAVMGAFPRAGFNGDGLKKIMCWLCRTKPETTYDNFVGVFGLDFGLDGKGDKKDEFKEAWQAKQVPHFLVNGLDGLQGLDDSQK